MAKILENTYRHVNIALVNELVKVCDELDVDLWNAIDSPPASRLASSRSDPGQGLGDTASRLIPTTSVIA